MYFLLKASTPITEELKRGIADIKIWDSLKGKNLKNLKLPIVSHYILEIKMDRKDKLQETAKNCINLLKDKFKVKKIFLIGSLAKGFIHERSDIDLVVEGLPPELYMNALTDLWDLLPMDVELNLIPFEDAFNTLKEKIEKEGKLVYG